MYAYCILAQFPFHLSYRLKVWGAFYIAYRSSDFRYYEVVVVLLSEQLYVPLYLIRDVWNNLNRLSQIIATSLLVYHSLVYASCGE